MNSLDSRCGIGARHGAPGGDSFVDGSVPSRGRITALAVPTKLAAGIVVRVRSMNR